MISSKKSSRLLSDMDARTLSLLILRGVALRCWSKLLTSGTDWVSNPRKRLKNKITLSWSTPTLRQDVSRLFQDPTSHMSFLGFSGTSAESLKWYWHGRDDCGKILLVLTTSVMLSSTSTDIHITSGQVHLSRV